MPAAVATIGMPAFRNARTIERALDSVLRQTERRFQVIVSDDGSPDGTRAIAARYASADPRVTVVAQERNLNYGNFRYVLNAANSSYFAWLAGDDWFEPDFLARCIACLESRPDAIAAVPRVLMHPDGQPPYLSSATTELSGSSSARIATYLQSPGDNSRMYGVFRTEAAQRAFPREDHHAFDWTFVANSLAFGAHASVAEILLHREVTPQSRYIDYVVRDARNVLERLVPLLPMTRALLANAAIPRTRQVLRALFDLNLIHHREYLHRFHPRIARLLAPSRPVGA